MKKFNPATRRKARHFLIQALYQWQMTGDDIPIIESQFVNDQADMVYFQEALRAIVKNMDEIDAQLSVFLDRKLTELDPVALAVLRLGTYELAHRLDIPYRVAVNEALEMAKLFSSPESAKYVNGVLDKVAHQLRQVEIGKL
jgi:transcription antitermination protein NusB